MVNRKKKCLLCGAGAETDLGLPSGTKYLLNTFFTKKTVLYNALDSFYNDSVAVSKKLPIEGYRKDYFLHKNSSAFLRLVEGIDDVDREILPSVLETPREDLSVASLSTEQREKLFNEFIDEGLIEDRGFSEKKSALYSLDLRNSSYYYGTLESLYANLLTPKENPGKFWRLINFYWSAFFSIVFPLLEGERGFDACPNLESKYSYVLNNLNWIVERLWSEDYLDDYGNGNSYYSAMRGAFDYVLTTNYTPLCRLVLKGEADERKRTIYLAGSLAQFESAVSFDTFDLSECGGKKGIADIEVPFPFLMTRSPIKPIINTCQLRAYSAALGALDQCDELVVLGYSFSDDDAHIAAIVRDYLRNGKMTYFAYSSNEQLDLSKIYSDLAKRLRVDETYLRDCCEIRRVKNYKSKGFSQKIAELKMKKNGERP